MRLPPRIFHGFMTVLFIFSAVVQCNDVYPWRWAAIYLAAAWVSGLATANRPRPRLAAVVLLVALAWMTPYVVSGLWRVSFPALFEEWEMKTDTLARGREMYGLFLVALGMAVACGSAQKRQNINAHNPAP